MGEEGAAAEVANKMHRRLLIIENTFHTSSVWIKVVRWL